MLGDLELTAGLRYFEDDVKQHEDPSVVIPGDIGDSKETFDALTPRLILSWKPSDDAMMYASYSEGFRSGNLGYSFVRRFGLPPVNPDTLRNYELGARGDLFQNQVRYDVALFYIDWQDIQQSRTIPSPLNPAVQVTGLINGESASGLGVDFGVTAVPIEGLTLAFNVGWNDLTYDSPVVSSGLVLADAGERIQLSPEYTAGASAEYSFALGGGYQGRVSAGANFNSEITDRQISELNVISASSDEILLGRASFTVEAPQNWSGTVFVDNITDENGATTRGAFSVQDVNLRPRPRTFGVQLEYRF